jgi:hypothetical protein
VLAWCPAQVKSPTTCTTFARNQAAVLGLTTYIDDSGSDDGAEHVIAGGILLSRIQARSFNRKWQAIARKHRLELPIHLADFQGHGKHSTILPEMKRCLFIELGNVIKTHRFYTVTVSVRNQDFQAQLSSEVRKALVSSYAFAFLIVVLCNRTLVEEYHRENPILGTRRVSYLVDSGFGHSEQLIEAHTILRLVEKREGENTTGQINFDLDDNWTPLQAADLISGTKRILLTGGGRLPLGLNH